MPVIKYNQSVNTEKMQKYAYEEKIFLKLPSYWINGYCFEIAHHRLQILDYHKSSLKSIHKNQQNFLKNSTHITALSAPAVIGFYVSHINSLYLFGWGTFLLEGVESRLIKGAMIIPLIRLSIDLPLVSAGFCQSFGYSYPFSRAWRMISFWVETLFWVSSQPAQSSYPKITCEATDGFRWYFLYHIVTSLNGFRPATHGLDVQGLTLINRDQGSSVDWTSTHAALVSFEKK